MRFVEGIIYLVFFSLREEIFDKSQERERGSWSHVDFSSRSCREKFLRRRRAASEFTPSARLCRFFSLVCVRFIRGRATDVDGQ